MIDKNNFGILIKRIHTTLEKNANNDLRKEDLTISQVVLLITLNETDNKKMTLKELEKSLHLAQSTVVGIVARLVEKKLVEYLENLEDKRIKEIKITEAGKKCCKLSKDRMVAVEEKLLSGLTETEREIFLKLLEKVSASID